MNYPLGRLVPSPDKQAQNDLHLFKSVRAPYTYTIEKEFPLPPLVAHYNQGNIGACTGYSASWLMSIFNNPEAYDAYWLYKRGQQTDGDPGTTGDQDGGYVWAVMDVLRKEGHKEPGKAVEKDNGIESYSWCRSADEVRGAFSLGRPVVFGINWYAKFNSPQTYNGEYWIGRQTNWGSILGGHAICAYAISDQRQAVRLVNTWGPTYPPVWISYNSINRLLSEHGECAVAIDIANVVPPEPDPEEDELPISITLDGISYAGTVTRV